LKDINPKNIDIYIKERTEDEENIKNKTGLTWRAVEATPTKLILEIEFDHPNQISKTLERDILAVNFKNRTLFKSK